MSAPIVVRVTYSGHERLNRQLEDFRNDVRERQKHARKLGGYVRTDARKNVKAQRTVEGGAFPRRKTSRRTGPMLQGLAKNMKVISKAREGGGVIVGWSNSLEAGIAGRHQWGVGEEWTRGRIRAQRGTPDYDAPCTRAQAKALLREGFRLPRKGRPPLRLTVRQIERMFTLGRAGRVLRYMRTGRTRGKQTWRDTVPVRDFLGVTDAQAEKHCEKLAKAIAKAAERSRR